jgi:hypothetical protein
LSNDCGIDEWDYAAEFGGFWKRGIRAYTGDADDEGVEILLSGYESARCCDGAVTGSKLGDD